MEVSFEVCFPVHVMHFIPYYFCPFPFQYYISQAPVKSEFSVLPRVKYLQRWKKNKGKKKKGKLTWLIQSWLTRLSYSCFKAYILNIKKNILFSLLSNAIMPELIRMELSFLPRWNWIIPSQQNECSGQLQMKVPSPASTLRFLACPVFLLSRRPTWNSFFTSDPGK